MPNETVFSGDNALRDYLDPENHPDTPLVELPASLNPFVKNGVRIYAKLMNQLPLQNVKSLPAFMMLKRAAESGQLKDITTLVENSSGNTAFSLAIIGRAFGIPRAQALVSNEVSRGKLRMLRVFGNEVSVHQEPICPDPADPESGINQAKQMAQNDRSVFNAGQYDNPNNPLAHERVTGPQIWRQLNGQLSLFVSGLGTTGTMVGTGSYLKRQSPAVKTLGVIRMPNNPVPGVRTQNLLHQIAFDWKHTVDYIEEVDTASSYRMSMQLCRSGLLVGPSSGFALAGLLQLIRNLQRDGQLDSLRLSNGDIPVVFICCDSPFPYLDEYFEHLDSNEFPPIAHEHLLGTNQSHHALLPQREPDPVREISADQAYTLLYGDQPAETLQNIVAHQSEQMITLSPNVVLLDVRTEREYDDVHLAGSQRIEIHSLLSDIQKYLPAFTRKQLIVYCRTGSRSAAAVRALNGEGIDAVSLRGGIAQWSAQNLPRVKFIDCKRKHVE